MDQPQPKNDLLWAFIARTFYFGIVSYVVVFAVAFILDLLCRSSVRIWSRYRHNGTPALLRRYLVNKHRDQNIIPNVEFLRIALNLLVCIIYVIGTYIQNVPIYMLVIYRVATAFFLIDLLRMLICSESAIATTLQWQLYAEAFSFPSMILAKGTDSYLNFAFLRAISLYRSFSVVERMLLLQLGSSKRLILRLIMQNLALFFTLAAGIQLLEVPGDLLPLAFRQRWENFGNWNFLNSCYFIIVTLSTVGYGDFSPSTIQGRIYTLFIIIVGIVIFASIASELVDHASRGRGSGSFVKSRRTRHVIITGSPNLTDLIHFVSEFYSDPRQSNSKAKIVVLVDEFTWSDMEWYQYIARNHFLQARLQYLNGSFKNTSDLSRAGIESADAVFILTSPSNGGDPASQDSKTAISALAIRNVRTDIPIYAQTLLEDSNLQTFNALATPSSFSSDENFYRESHMHKYSSYPGLFCKVLEAEFEKIPEVHRQNNSNEPFADVLHRYKTENQARKPPSDSVQQLDDLARSQNVCRQEIHMGLMAGNIKANGVGTLLSNMYLDVKSTKMSKDEPSWLLEYHMGATCGLSYAIVPPQLDGIEIREIAPDLFHLGLLILATSEPTKIAPKPVLGTDARLHRGDLAMILSYHEYHAVGAALNLVALRCGNEKLLHKDSLQYNHGKTNEEKEIAFNCPKKENNPFPGDSAVPRREHGQDFTMLERLQRFNVSLSLRRSHSGDDLDALIEEDNFSDDEIGGNLVQSATLDAMLDINQNGYLPEQLKGHVIIASEGEVPLRNLPLLLKNLWWRDNRKSMRNVRKATIIVVHPSIPEQFRKRFSRFEGRSLFFVEGSPTSRATWRKARLDTAKAVATMADYTQGWEVTDAHTIFTLLTLDVTTKSDQNLFICSELVDEKSLKYLREPLHARRKGASLGEANNALSRAHTLHSNGANEDFPTLVGNEENVKEAQADSDLHSVPIVQQNRKYAATEEGSRSRTLRSMRTKKSRIDHHSQKKAMTLKPNPGTEGAVGTSQENPPDPDIKPGAARARRGTLFSTSRYASGELLVQSSAITLLAREYIEPGFVRFFTSILGTDSRSHGMKIRLVRIPPAMFDPRNGLACRHGRRLVRYNSIFKALIRIGVTPLGIYRSGTAPIMLPSKSRKKRGQAIYQELKVSLKENRNGEDESIPEQNIGNSRREVFVRNFISTISEVLPQRVQDNEGRVEVHGDLGNEDEGSTSDISTEFPNGSGDEEAKKVETNISEDEENASAQPVGSLSTDIGSQVAAQQSETWVHRMLSRKSQRFTRRKDRTIESQGHVKYMEKKAVQTLLPYVYTLPDPNTWCAETDAIYILCRSSFDLPRRWSDTSDNVNKTKVSDLDEYKSIQLNDGLQESWAK